MSLFRANPYRLRTPERSANLEDYTDSLQDKVAAAKDSMNRAKKCRSPPRCKEVAAEVYGFYSGGPLFLKDSPEKDQRIESAKAKFRAQWKLEHALDQNDIIVPTDASTMKLLFASE